MNSLHVLIIDDEKNICATLKDILMDWGCNVETAKNGELGIKKCSITDFDLVLLDVALPGIDGIEAFSQIRESLPDTEILMISGHSGIDVAVKAIKLGAYDFIEKPLSMAKVQAAVRNINEKKKLSSRLSYLNEKECSDHQIIGSSLAIKNLLSVVERVAPTDSKVLILGETGTGKELIARNLHFKSNRKDRPFIAFNSAAIPAALVESELFGYDKGAFTGADRTKPGKFELADGGTLFLDEIGDMSMDAQMKLLRVIQEGTFEHLGGTRTYTVDVRIIAATHMDLEKMISEGQFREDLYYRLNVLPLHVPPLKARLEDLDVLIPWFLRKLSVELNLPEKFFNTSAIEQLKRYSFPGNVRELRNILERLYLLTLSDTITKNDINKFVKFLNHSIYEGEYIKFDNFADAKRKFETKYLQYHLQKNEWNLTRTSDSIGVHQPNLSRKMKELKIKKNNSG